MLFNTFEFLLFFTVVFGGCFFIPQHRRWVFLLASSYVFYMSWNWKYMFLIVATTATTYLAGITLGQASSEGRRKLVLAACVTVNLGLLAIFKYLNFFIGTVNDIGHFVGTAWDIPTVRLLLPVGISFYTFQALSYAIDVYRKNTQVERHFGRFALYVSFFPQLVAGPIERSMDLLPQFRRNTYFEVDRVRAGLVLILWGLFKKVCVADMIAPFVGMIYSRPESFNGTLLSVASVLFYFQIYCDFSGYTDIAIGLARMLGYDLSINFRQPYFARSLAEFWRRWHITLMRWFRDYLYIPLGGSRLGVPRWCANVVIVFTLSGLWHGAAWTFVIFGAIHGLWILFERLVYGLSQRSRALTRWPRLKVAPLVHWAITFAVIMLSLPFFRGPRSAMPGMC